MHNRLQTRVRRTFDSRKDMMASRERGAPSPTSFPPDVRASSAQAPRAAGALPKELRVLVIDNDIRAAEFLELLLHAGGYSRTRMAYTAHAALGIAESFRPELVLMELDLRDMGSDHLGQALRAQAQSQRVRLIAVTQGGTLRDRDIDPNASFERYLFKPITAPDLGACLSEDANALAINQCRNPPVT
jgi:CheY-like chemotaxis protein